MTTNDAMKVLTWTAIGGFTGLITFVFAIWDRLIRNRPVAWLVAKPIGRRSFPYVRVKNFGRTDILITNIRSKDAAYTVGDSESVAGVVRATVGETVIAVITPDEERDFPIWLHSPKPDEHLRIFISWRLSSSTWLPQFRKKLRSNQTHVEAITEASLRQFERG